MTANRTSGLGGAKVFVLPATAAYANLASNAFATTAVDGQWSVYEIDKPTPAAAIVPGNKYHIVQKNHSRDTDLGTETLISGWLWDMQVRACPYLSPSKQIQTFTVLSTAALRDESFTLLLQNATNPYDYEVKERYTFVSVTGAETPTQIAAGIYNEWLTRKTMQTNFSQGMPTNYELVLSGATITIQATNSDIERFSLHTPETYFQATIVETQPWAYGTLTENAIQLEFEGDNFDGLIVPDNANRREYWGRHLAYTKEGATYDWFFIKNYYEEQSLINAPLNKNEQYSNVVVLCETTVPGVSGSANFTQLRTIFGV